MPKYVRKNKKVTRKLFKKPAAAKRAPVRKTNRSLISLIKKVSLKQTETKDTHYLSENNQLLHNNGFQKNNLLYVTQGVTDTSTGTSAYSNMIGDQLIARGISIKLWIANKLDRPNVMYRMFVYKYQVNSSPSISILFKGANPNKMMDDLNKEYVTIVYHKVFNLQMGYSAYATGTAGDTDGREAHTYKQIWIPLYNKKIQYNDGNGVPKFFDYGFCIMCYDSYGTLITDNIASLAFQYKLYFKDP